MDSHHYAESLIAPFGPTRPLPELIVELNRIYHSFEAQTYDDSHDEIFHQLPGIWAGMVEAMLQVAPKGARWKILDFGCGTGFEAGQMLVLLGSDRIESLVCYDPSPEMLDRCRKRLSAVNDVPINFTTVLPEPAGFNLLLTNSLLHHLPDIPEFCRLAQRYLGPGSFWLAGHEPNQKFYLNPSCTSFASILHLRRRARKALSLRHWASFLARKSGTHLTIAHRTGEAASRQGLFLRKPTPRAIEKLVDFGVPHDSSEALAGRGITIDRIRGLLSPAMRLVWSQTYNFMGPFYESDASGWPLNRSLHLQRRFPDCGAQCCAVWTC